MLTRETSSKLNLFPLTAQVDEHGHLHIGGCDVVELVKEYGSPLYLFDEFTLRHKCHEFKAEFTKRYSNTLVIYAAKAFLNRALALIFKEEGLGLDVVSGGELSIARSAAFPLGKVYFHGNNKTVDELKLALDWGVGRIVVDNFYELELVNRLAMERNINQDILLRITPGVDAHTHRYTTTGIIDSKFGFPLTTGQAETALIQAMSAANLNLLGLHFHLGSPVSDILPYQVAIDLVLRFAAEAKAKHGFQLAEFSPGGGFAVQYILDSPVPAAAEYAEAIVFKLTDVGGEVGLTPPCLVIEPGRGIVGQAGVALYTVGAVKDIPQIRKYICVDGGIGDNVRAAFYGAKYEALVANKALRAETERVTIAGKFCESGDILARDIKLASVLPGDIIAIPVCGAYCIPMSSNYNASLRPTILMANQSKARLIRRRESYEDLTRLDLV